MKIGILNIGGNSASIWYALERLGHKAVIISKLTPFYDALVIPGQGRFDVGLDRISTETREDILNFNRPVIGICLGMQLLFEESEEGTGRGLGVFKGRLIKLPATHIGWSKCSNENYYYFAHSYHVPSNWQRFKDLVCKFEKIDFIASCHKDNFVGCQFHPEKSGKAGEEFLKMALKC